MKLKINLFDRGKTDPSGAAYTTDIPVTSAMDLGEENQLRKEIINEADELGQKTIEKKGKGFNLDFEYDDSKCGFIGEYGFDLLKKENQNSKFVVAPVFGVYDYTPPTDEDAESFKGTIGVASEFNKTWADGQSVNASMYAVCNRVVAKGHHPQDTQYLVFKGGYNNPKKKFSVNADAGLVRTNAMNVAYAEADVNYSTKNFDLGLETGYARFKAYGKSDHDYQVALKCKYNIPYKTKK